MPTATLGSMNYQHSFIDIRDIPHITFIDEDEI